MHQFFPLNSGSKQAPPILYYSLLSFMTMSHTGSLVLKEKHFPGSEDRGTPGQSIMLCVLMIDSCRRGTRSSQRQQAWKGVNQLSGVVIWRTARLWLEFSIRTSTIHHAIRERGDTHTHISPSALPAMGKVNSEALKKKGIWMSYAHKQVLFREWRVKDFLGLHSYCILSAHSRLRAAQPLRLWERGTALPLSPLYRCTHRHLSKKVTLETFVCCL